MESSEEFGRSKGREDDDDDADQLMRNSSRSQVDRVDKNPENTLLPPPACESGFRKVSDRVRRATIKQKS